MLTDELKELLYHLCYNCDEPVHVERAIDVLIKGVNSLGSIIGVNLLPERQVMIDYVLDQW